MRLSYALLVVMALVLSAAAVSVRGAWRDMGCAMNVENIATAMRIYCVDWDGRFPDPDRWADQLGLEYLKNL